MTTRSAEDAGGSPLAGPAQRVVPDRKTKLPRLEGGPYRWVYLWGLPLRSMHWVAAVALVVLVVTGLFIGKPYFMVGTTGGATPFTMGWMRFLHLAAAGVLIATGIIRVYWLLMGNRYERWNALLPWHPKDWWNALRVLHKYVFIYPEKSPHYLGHNPLQQISYTFVYLLVVIQVVTGFAMYGLSNPDGFFFWAFGWVGPLFGGIQVVRLVHHALTWLFLAFIPVHVYLTIRADALHREGRVSSMVSGGRFVRDDLEYVDE